MCVLTERDRSNAQQLVCNVLWFLLLVWRQIYCCTCYYPVTKFGSIKHGFVWIFARTCVLFVVTFLCPFCAFVLVNKWNASMQPCFYLGGRTISLIAVAGACCLIQWEAGTLAECFAAAFLPMLRPGSLKRGVMWKERSHILNQAYSV